MLKLHRRSEYAHALNLARRARRRGDAADADRWLKQADRLLLISKREEDILHTMEVREAGTASRAHARTRGKPTVV